MIELLAEGQLLLRTQLKTEYLAEPSDSSLKKITAVGACLSPILGERVGGNGTTNKSTSFAVLLKSSVSKEHITQGLNNKPLKYIGSFYHRALDGSEEVDVLPQRKHLRHEPTSRGASVGGWHRGRGGLIGPSTSPPPFVSLS